MQSLSLVVSKYFKEEKILKEFDADLVYEKQSAFGLPLYSFIPIKPIVKPRIRMAETERYLFMDLRYRVTSLERIFNVIVVVFLLLAFGKLALNSPITLLLLVMGLFMVATICYKIIYFDRGLGIKVYKKEWISQKDENGQLNMEIHIPKYSRDEVYKYIAGTRIADFLGITVSSADLKMNYTFKPISNDTPVSKTLG